jgi:hypothetical protein
MGTRSGSRHAFVGRGEGREGTRLTLILMSILSGRTKSRRDWRKLAKSDASDGPSRT